ncbi:MAG: hypothetical protein ABGZ35_26775 [Planctomycetaceae bacterium]
MNYFAHGLRFIDRPYYLAGTAVPDWLAAADSRVRMRHRNVLPVMEHAEPDRREVAEGVLQHLDDDQWFHATRGFVEITGEVTRRLRNTLGSQEGYRPSFVGHIATELLLDGVLIEQYPGRIEAYYQALTAVNPVLVQEAVNGMSPQSTDQLTRFIGLFLQSEFLRDYGDPKRLLSRLNQVMQRIRLNQLPDSVEGVLVSSWDLVRDRMQELLPPESFGT